MRHNPSAQARKIDEPSDAPQPRTVLYFNGKPIPRGGVIRAVLPLWTAKSQRNRLDSFLLLPFLS